MGMNGADKKQVITELAMLLNNAAQNNPNKVMRNTRGGETKEFVLPFDLSESEKNAVEQLLDENGWLLKVSSGKVDIAELSHEAKQESHKVNELRKAYEKAEAEFAQKFPDMKNSRKLNEAAKEIVQTAINGYNGSKKIPMQIVSSLKPFLPNAEEVEVEEEDEGLVEQEV